MLFSLQIKDYALIENITVEFEKGLNIITGETGAGKSIILDAMGLLLGERASTDIIRKGTTKSVVEGIFDISGNGKVNDILTENDMDTAEELIVRREISLKGSNRCFLNDTPCSLNLIKDVGNLLVDLHGQHEHQSLLRTETHIEMLDDFGEIKILLEEYQKKLNKLKKLLSESKELKKNESLLREKRGLYEFQIKEIDAISPETGEDEKLSEELNILENSENLAETTSNIYEELFESDSNLYDNLVKIQDKLENLSEIDKSFLDQLKEFESSINVIKDLAEFVRNYNDRLDLDPKLLNEVRSRANSIQLLKKKYGGTLENLLEYRAKIGEEFELTNNFKEKLELLESEIYKLRVDAGDSASKLSDIRKEIAKNVKSEVENSLKFLDIKDALFEVRFKRNFPEKGSDNYLISENENFSFTSRGIDDIEFFISTNIGEDPKPLSKTASGGEISRIMLALKSTLAKNDKLPILIFDEIDTGISGRVAQKVGSVLQSLASFHQIISITHLPQIAGFADSHYAVEKKITGSRAVSSIRKLEPDESVFEIAKLLSGEKVTDVSLNTARELVNQKGTGKAIKN